MATVTKRFKDNFDTWAFDRLARGQFTDSEMNAFKDMLRQDLTPGPDQLRAGYTVIIASGVEIPATIDDHNERYRLWAEHFATEAEAIRSQAHS